MSTVAIQCLQNMSEKQKQMILMALNGIDWSGGALSDDEGLNYRNQDVLSNSYL